MKKISLLVIFVFTFISAGCNQSKVVEFKKAAPAIEMVSPNSKVISALEHKPFTVTVKVIPAGKGKIVSYWIWKDTIAGYGTSVTITPTEEDGGKILPLTFYAIQNGVTSTFEYSVNVSEVDDPPYIVSFSPAVTSMTLKTGDSETFTIEGKDPDSTIQYTWLVNGETKGYGNSFTFTATKEKEGKKFIIEGVVQSNGKKDYVKWTVTVLHYDYPPEVELPIDTLFISSNISFPVTFKKVFDLTKYIQDPDNSFDQLKISFDTPYGVEATVEDNRYLSLTINDLNADTEGMNIKVSDGEKTAVFHINIATDDYLIFKNEYTYSLSAFAYNQMEVFSPVEGSESKYVISTMAIPKTKGDSTNLYAFTTWGAYKLLTYSPVSLQLIDEKDISYCASSPYEAVSIGSRVIFTNLYQFPDPITTDRERFSVFYPEEDTCNTYPIYTTGISQNAMGYEGITVAYPKDTPHLYLAATGLQPDYSFKDSYLTTITVETLSPDAAKYEVFHKKINNCTNLQSVKAIGDYLLFAVCSGDYANRATGSVIAFDISSGYPQEITRVILGKWTYPTVITPILNKNFEKKPVTYEILVGSYSGKLFKLTLQGDNLTVEYIVTFNNYGYGAWTSVVPVVINNEYGAVVSSYGMDSKLFLNLSNEDPTNGWHYIFDFGPVGTSQWVEW